MKERIADLVGQIKTLKSNSDYRVSDVIFNSGCRWKHSSDMVLSNSDYDNTILKKYLTELKGKSTDLNFFFECIDFIRKSQNLPVPTDNEIVIHLRMGDVTEIPWFISNTPKYYSNLKERLDSIIENNTIDKITIVTCFAYQAWSDESIHLKPKHVPEWNYTDEKQEINIKVMSSLISNLLQEYDQEICIQSSENPDSDIVYCTSAKHFIHDIRRPGTHGFSALLKKLNHINTK